MTSQTIDSETLLECPKIPVGGRLKFFVDRWESITDDRWVLETIQNGLKFEFISHPFYSYIRKTTVHAQNRDIFTDEVEKLLQKAAIVPIHAKQTLKGFYSTLFLVKTPYETCKTSPSSLLGSELERSRSHDTHYSTPQRSFKLVASASKHANGQIFTTMVYKQSAYHRCIKDGVRSPHGRALFSRNLLGFGSQTAHKHIRVTGSAQSSSPFSSFVEGPEGTCSVRQCDSCTIFEQAGRNEVPNSVLQSLESVSLCNSESNRPKSGPYSGKTEHSCRSIVQKTSTHISSRVDSEQSNCQSDFPDMGQAAGRPICLSTESEDSSILLMDSQSPGTGSGCTVNSLGGNVCIRIPTDSSDPKSITTHVSVHMPTDFSSPPVASSPLVHSPVRNGNRFSKNSSSKRKSAKSAKCKGVSP